MYTCMHKNQHFILDATLYLVTNVVFFIVSVILVIDSLYLKSNESDSVELTKLPRCLTLSDQCTGNPLIDTCSSILILFQNLIHTVYIGLNVISYYFSYSQHITTISFNPRTLGHSNVISSA